MAQENPSFAGFTPYLHYDDLPSAIEWLTRVFGFVEKGRWQDEQGTSVNAELLAGNVELWLDGTPGWWAKKGRKAEEWIGVWTNDVDAIFERVTSSGVQVGPPQHKFYGVRLVQVTDPQGYTWGFMQRAPFIARSPK